MIPDYQSLMRPVLACAVASETRIGDAVEQLADKLDLTQDEHAQLLPSGKQTNVRQPRALGQDLLGQGWLGRRHATRLLPHHAARPSRAGGRRGHGSQCAR